MTSYRFGLGVSDDHDALSDAVWGIVEKTFTDDVRREAVEKPMRAAADTTWWKSFADQGLLGLHLPGRVGGQDGGMLELVVALEAIGRAAAPGAIVPTVLASAVLAQEHRDEIDEIVRGLADGSRTATVSLAGGIAGRREGADVIVSGKTGPVLAVTGVDDIVLPVDIGGEDGDTVWAIVPTSEVVFGDADGVDVVRPSGLIQFDEVRVPAAHLLAGVDTATVRAAASIVLGGEAVGVVSWCVETAAEYAKVREQFGRPIGQFQGVKHRCAEMAIVLEQARATVWDAARAWDEGSTERDYAAAIAAYVAPDAAVRASRDNIQVLGGIGYTWEHAAHHFYRRALVLRALLGTSRSAAIAVAKARLAGRTRPIVFELPEAAESIRSGVREELLRIAELSDDEQLVELGDGGWVLPHLEEPFGRSAGPLEQLVIAEEIERTGVTMPELGLASWVLPSIAVHATPDQAERLVDPTLRSEIFWCQLFSEPGAGSDLASLRTSATKTDGGWLINGQKIWTSLAFLADWGALIARTDPTVPKHQGITYFAVQMDAKGVTVRPLREASGGSLFAEVFFDDVFIPDQDVIGGVGNGWQVARGTLNNERVALGKGNAMYAKPEEMVELAQRRDDFDLQALGKILADQQSMQLLNMRAVLQQIRGRDAGASSNVAKLINMRVGQAMADLCHAELGADGVIETADPATARWTEQTLSSRAMTIYGGTSEIQLNVIGERLLGLPRDPAPVKA